MTKSGPGLIEGVLDLAKSSADRIKHLKQSLGSTDYSYQKLAQDEGELRRLKKSRQVQPPGNSWELIVSNIRRGGNVLIGKWRPSGTQSGKNQ